MGDDERSVALKVACDDLQAQLEAGDRSMRHLDDDLSRLQDPLDTTLLHAENIGNLQRHMRELRANMREQRQALREVRAAARSLCALVARTREGVASLADEKAKLDRNHATLDEQQMLQLTPLDEADEETTKADRTEGDTTTSG